MPDIPLYVKAFCVSCGASMVFVLALIFLQRRRPLLPVRLITVIGTAAGLTAGFAVLGFQLKWPPANALDRLLMLVMPAVVVTEIIAESESIPRLLRWMLRILLSLSVVRILLHGSVYLDISAQEWTRQQMLLIPVLLGIWLLTELRLLQTVAVRAGAATIPFALAGSILCSGLAILLAGYIRGGAAAFPLSGAVLGIGIASAVSAERVSVSGVAGIALFGLFGLLFIGRFFGALTGQKAAALFLAPLCCLITEWPWLRRRQLKPWQASTVRLLALMIILAPVMFAAWQDFELKMGTLLDR